MRQLPGRRAHFLLLILLRRTKPQRVLPRPRLLRRSRRHEERGWQTLPRFRLLILLPTRTALLRLVKLGEPDLVRDSALPGALDEV